MRMTKEQLECIETRLYILNYMKEQIANLRHNNEEWTIQLVINNTSRLVVSSLELQFVLKYKVDTTTKYSFEKSIKENIEDYEGLLEIEEYQEILEQAKEIYQ